MKYAMKSDLCGQEIEIRNPKDLGIGMDGYIYQGDVYVNGKMIGIVRDNGDGGSPIFTPKGKDASMIYMDLNKICKKLDIFDEFAGFCAEMTATLLDSIDNLQ